MEIIAGHQYHSRSVFDRIQIVQGSRILRVGERASFREILFGMDWIFIPSEDL